LAALLDPSTHRRAPLTHASHYRPTLVHLSHFRVSPILIHSRFMRFSICVAAVSSVSLVHVGVSLSSADVAVMVLAALLDPSTHYGAPLTHASHHRPLNARDSHIVCADVFIRHSLGNYVYYVQTATNDMPVRDSSTARYCCPLFFFFGGGTHIVWPNTVRTFFLPCEDRCGQS
jgi:hypothetical protein